MCLQHSTMESLLERGEKIDDLVSKSEVLGIHSKAFYKTVRTSSLPLCPRLPCNFPDRVVTAEALLEQKQAEALSPLPPGSAQEGRGLFRLCSWGSPSSLLPAHQ